MRLLDQRTTDGDSETLDGEEGVFKLNNRQATFAVEGVFDSATQLILEWQKISGTTWNPFHNAAGTFTAPGIKVLYIPAPQDELIRVRARLVNSGASTNITVHADS